MKSPKTIFNPVLLLALPAALGTWALPAGAQPGSSQYVTPYGIQTIAGLAGMYGTNNGIGSMALFDSPGGVAVDFAGDIYVADTLNDSIRELTPAGTNWNVTTLAGQPGGNGYGDKDGTNSGAQFYSPGGVAVDNWGNLYVADTDNSTIRKVAHIGADWVVTTLAGAAGVIGTNDGTNLDARFAYPFGVAVDFATNVYVADLYNDTIRKLTPMGTNWVVTTLAGLGGYEGTNDGIGGAARFYNPAGIAVDNNSNIYVADTYNDTIRKLTPVGADWMVSTIAGQAEMPGSEDGTNGGALFSYPFGVAVDNAGNLYVADQDNDTIRRLRPMGSNWVATTLAGLAEVPGASNGTGSNALFNGPRSVALDAARNLYVADTDNDTIRMGTPAVPTNFSGALPVYEVAQAGATPAQATNLAGFLGIPSAEMVFSNGLVSFIDAGNFLYVPVTNVLDAAQSNYLSSQTSNQYAKIPLSMEAIDFGSLSNLTVLTNSAALSLVDNAFDPTGLWPQFGTPFIGHAAIAAVMTNGSGFAASNSLPLDTEVNFQFSDPNGYPLIGPGAQVQADFGSNGNVTRLLYSARQMTPGPLVQIMSPAEASNAVAGLFPPNANINLQLVYWCPPFLPPAPAAQSWTPTNIIPWYYCTATLTQSNAFTNAIAPLTLMAQMIPATTNPAYVPSVVLSLKTNLTNVTASAMVTGGAPPYSFLWGGSDPAISSNSLSASVTYTPEIRLEIPTLAVTAAGNGTAVISWPGHSAGFVLQTVTNLPDTNSESAWTVVTNTVQTNFAVNAVTVSNLANAQYFRLILPDGTVDVNETVTVTVTDANGVSAQANQTVAAEAVPARQPGTNVAGTNYGVESPFESPYASSLGTADRAGWQTGMNAGSNYQTFCWTGGGSWPGDFIEPPAPGALPPEAWIYGDADYMDDGVNSAAIVLYVGQGNPNQINFIIDSYASCLETVASSLWEPYGQLLTNPPFPFAVTMPDACSAAGVDYSVTNYPGSWQNSVSNQSGNLSWLCLLSPDALDEYDAATNAAWTRWGPGFNGLHLLTGFASEAQSGTGLPRQFADYMLGAAPAGSTNVVPLTIAQSWLSSADKQGTGAGAALGPITTNGVCDLNDHYWSKGPVGPSIKQNQILGWWYIYSYPDTP